MSVYATDKGGDFALPPQGTFIARCVQVLDIGSHTWKNTTDTITNRKVRISWELPTELHVFDESRGQEPFLVSKEYTLSTNAKSNLRQHLEAWRGKPLTDEEAKKFDVARLLSVPCQISIIHSKTTAGKDFAKITAVTPPMKGVQIPAQILPSVEYSVDQGRNAVFQSLPEWIKKKISECEEWKTYPSVQHDQTPAEADVPGDEGSDVPF